MEEELDRHFAVETAGQMSQVSFEKVSIQTLKNFWKISMPLCFLSTVIRALVFTPYWMRFIIVFSWKEGDGAHQIFNSCSFHYLIQSFNLFFICVELYKVLFGVWSSQNTVSHLLRPKKSKHPENKENMPFPLHIKPVWISFKLPKCIRSLDTI